MNQPTIENRSTSCLSTRVIVARWAIFLAGFAVANRLVRWIDLRATDIDRPPYWPIGVLELCRPTVTSCLAAAACLGLFGIVVVLLERCRYRLIPVITGGLALIVATNSLHGVSSGFVKPIAGADGIPRIQYFDDALRVNSVTVFLNGFNKSQPSMLDHARTHPPGAVLIIYALNHLLGDPARIALALATISTVTIAMAVYWVVRRGRPTNDLVPGVVTFVLLLLPAVQIYALASVDAVIAGLIAASIAFFISPRTIPSLIGCALCLFLASTLTFAALFLPPVLLVTEWVNRRRWNRTACVVAVTVILHVCVFCLTGFDYRQGFQTASSLENPNGFRLLNEPISFAVTRIECVAEILVFLGPIALAMITAALQLMDHTRRAMTLAAGVTLLAMFATGAFHTAETARACLFIVPFLALPMAEWCGRWCVTSKTRWRVVACVFGQSLVMQLLGDFFW
ncbi:MAG: hypothetical protein HZA51_09460 [Planctomycetes bacterium]|nr:hypothetical protein [Planctomycetota bacterium]